MIFKIIRYFSLRTPLKRRAILFYIHKSTSVSISLNPLLIFRIESLAPFFNSTNTVTVASWRIFSHDV
jgi:hypothetical protein